MPYFQSLYAQMYIMLFATQKPAWSAASSTAPDLHSRAVSGRLFPLAHHSCGVVQFFVRKHTNILAGQRPRIDRLAKPVAEPGAWT
jgi:hypothetical protein